MATIQNVIDNIIRVDISDEIGSRYTNTQLLTFFKQAIRRTQGIGYKNRLNFMRIKFDFTLQADSYSYLLPTNFLVQQSLYRLDTNQPIPLMTDDEYDQSNNPSVLSGYVLETSGTATNLVFSCPPTEATPMRLRYYVNVNPDQLTLSSNMPWNGKLDFIIAEYVNLRAFHVDRYDLSADLGLLQDMEKTIINMFINLDPIQGEAIGAF